MQTTPGFDVMQLFKFLKMLWRFKVAMSAPPPSDSSATGLEKSSLPLEKGLNERRD